jgi:hypothetical protein
MGILLCSIIITSAQFNLVLKKEHQKIVDSFKSDNNTAG